MFQSTRPRGARQRRCSVGLSRFGVSIHAPAWGATRPPRHTGPIPGCFNPRARVGRDSPAASYRPHSRMFQSTRPRGARQELHKNQLQWRVVSIHAPAWGATTPAATGTGSGTFQSTRPRGARRMASNDRSYNISFQSTRPRGARHEGLSLNLQLVVFQSTRPRGARRVHHRRNHRGQTFQSTRPRGARLRKFRYR